jgi:hypothetical protein
MPTGRQVKSARTEIDEEALQLFKSIVSEKAALYERCYVAELGKRLADEIKAKRREESVWADSPAGRRRWRRMRERERL